MDEEEASFDIVVILAYLFYGLERIRYRFCPIIKVFTVSCFTSTILENEEFLLIENSSEQTQRWFNIVIGDESANAPNKAETRV